MAVCFRTEMERYNYFFLKRVVMFLRIPLILFICQADSLDIVLLVDYSFWWRMA